ncbi:MAG: dCTP deaminase [Candidatus Thorarchaeota archaeon]
MMLSDADIRKAIRDHEISISPLDQNAIGPCSVDLRLDSVFRIYHPGPPVDIHAAIPHDKDTHLVDTNGEPFMILPGQFILGQTMESISVSEKYAGLLEGRSSIARLGIIVHAAGLVNPGTGVDKPGRLTLEIFCENLSPVMLYPGMRIVQVMFIPLSSKAETGYDKRAGSRYVGQRKPDID